MITTHVVHVYGDNINTDLIFAGKYTYTLREQHEIVAHAMEDLDKDFASRVCHGDVIVAGKNWGNGSSREQAVTCLKWSGISMIIATSFGGLYTRNCINQGVHPVICSDIQAHIKTGDSIQVDHTRQLILVGTHEFVIPPLSPSVRAILDAGGLVPMLGKRFQKG
jgi:3-isopropylmalate/(R)-2-methylmalate dehydratase small subunit